MTRDELLEKLKSIKAEQLSAENKREYSDKESQHYLADDYLLQYINDYEITQTFESIERWYC